MLKYFRNLTEALSKLTNNASVSPEETIRFKHFTVFLALGIPTMVAYGLYHLFASHYLLCVLILLSAMGLVLGWFSLMHLENGRNVYRFNIVLFAGLLLYMVFIGGEEGGKILWMYTCPLIIFFLLGKKKGCFGVLF